MPEGDTIFRTARTLERALGGKRVTRFESVFPHVNRIDEDDPIAGRQIECVRSRGKHLLIHFSGNLTLLTHMRMKGSWHIYRHHEDWQRSKRNARIILETEDLVAVGFSIPVAECFPSHDESRQNELSRLGPDLLSDRFDRETAIFRMRSLGDTTAADALLDQRVMAGVGNVYKSEILFLCGIAPHTSIESLDEDLLGQLVDTARRLLARNVAPETSGTRQTTSSLDPSVRLWVYGRGSKPCRRCGSIIRRELIGRNARATYWCPDCQESHRRNHQ